MKVWPLAVLLLAAASSMPAQAAPPGLTPTTFVDLAKAQRPVVVSISTVQLSAESAGRSPEAPSLPPQQDPFSYRSQSVGTGFIISADGLVLTNNHVIDRSERVGVTLWSGKEYDARVIGRDAKTDLALIRMIPLKGETETFPAARFGDSDLVEVGEWVAAIGNPFGLQQTLTIGILSGKGRAIGTSPYEEYLQTDASINPGSSGGPLFNIQGEVIGITTAINPSGQGIGFAIPSNQVKLLLPQLMAGKVRRGWIGVMVRPNPDALPSGPGPARIDGVLVTEVLDDSPAARAGLKQGDVIVEFNGTPIATLRDLPRRVASTTVGAAATVKLYRNGKLLTTTVTVDELEE